MLLLVVLFQSKSNLIMLGSGRGWLWGIRRSAQTVRQSGRVQKRSGPETELDSLFPYAVEP